MPDIVITIFLFGIAFIVQAYAMSFFFEKVKINL